jgi:hypothetical protein
MMSGRDRIRWTHAWVVALGWTAAGCAGSGDDLPREPVSGTVTLDSQPLANGTIQFNPMSEATGTAVSGGATIANGQFSIARQNGLVPGTYRVAIYAAAKTGERTKPAEIGGAKRSELPKELIPSKYNANSELKAEIPKGGKSDLKFDLQSK